MLKQFATALIITITLLVVPRTAHAQTSKQIMINTETQRLYAFENNKLIYDIPVSTGLPTWPTPQGTFYPWIKLRYDRMIGGVPGTESYYDLPNVPYVVYFANNQISETEGYAIHGTYWHNNFGNPMSHGCVNLRTEDAKDLYNWIDLPSTSDPGTKVIIY